MHSEWKYEILNTLKKKALSGKKLVYVNLPVTGIEYVSHYQAFANVIYCFMQIGEVDPKTDRGAAFYTTESGQSPMVPTIRRVTPHEDGDVRLCPVRLHG